MLALIMVTADMQAQELKCRDLAKRVSKRCKKWSGGLNIQHLSNRIR